MKRGNNSVLAIAMLLIFLMIFILFRSQLDNNLGSNNLNGFFTFDVSGVVRNASTGSNFEGDLSFSLVSTDVSGSKNITNNSYIRLILFNQSNSALLVDKQFTLEYLRDKTTPSINFIDYSNYKAINLSSSSVNFKFPISTYLINYPVSGNYSLSFDLWYGINPDQFILSERKILNVTIEGNSITVIGDGTNKPVLLKSIPDIDLTSGPKSFSLKDYFADPSGEGIIFSADGALKGELLISDEGIASLTKDENSAGEDVLFFIANNSFGETNSNNVTVIYSVVNETAIEEVVNEPVVCEENWQCEEWAKCADEKRTRNCVDQNSCGTENTKPQLEQKCNVIGEEPLTQTASTSGREEVTNSEKLPLQKLETKGPISLPIFIAIVLTLCLVLGGSAFYYFKYIKKSDVGIDKKVEEKKEEKSPITGGITGVKTEVMNKTSSNVSTNLDPIFKYLENVSGQGIELNQAKLDLINAGWKKEDVERATNIFSLRKYVDSKLKMGFDKEVIRKTLVAKGWKEDLLDEVFKL